MSEFLGKLSAFLTVHGIEESLQVMFLAMLLMAFVGWLVMPRRVK
jgi:hypothetical protein